MFVLMFTKEKYQLLMTLQTCPWCRPSSAPCWPAQTPPARPRGRWAHRSPRRIQPPAGPKGGTTVPPMGGGPRVGLGLWLVVDIAMGPNMLGMGQTIWFIWVEFKYRCGSFGCLWKTSWDRCNCEVVPTSDARSFLMVFPYASQRSWSLVGNFPFSVATRLAKSTIQSICHYHLLSTHVVCMCIIYICVCEVRSCICIYRIMISYYVLEVCQTMPNKHGDV